MQRRVVRRILLRTFAIALLMQPAVYGQSLGEVARENRDKQNADDASPAAKPKVITNKDLPKDPDADQAPSQTPAVVGAAPTSKGVDPFSEKPSADHSLADQGPSQQRLAQQRAADRQAAQQHLAQQRSAEQWKRQILIQKNKMANLQARIDQLQVSIRSVDGSVQSQGPYTRYQAQQLQRLAQVRQQFNQEKWKLDQMQDAARHAGMHTVVYDP